MRRKVICPNETAVFILGQGVRLVRSMLAEAKVANSRSQNGLSPYALSIPLAPNCYETEIVAG